MISNCPHCNKPIKLSDSQQTKIKSALAKVKPGKPLKFGCPDCKKPIELNADGSLFSRQKQKAADQKAGKPDTGSSQPAKPPAGSDKDKEAPKPVNPPPDPPPPPDLSWLTSGKTGEKGVIENVPTAMVLMPEGASRSKMEDAFREMDYQLFLPKTADEAIESMQFKEYAAAAFHISFEGGTLEDSVFHSHMKVLSMVKRRYMYYVLIGPDFRTYYDLEALANSANVVVNDKDMENISTIMKKGKNDYDELFGPFLAMLKANNKR
ncbi:MAG: hypothetical protein GY795_33750 [Desulfobacterales bacterium]|nr:hypothetical protein [Desulfobacterales bacterium]